jgi:hypothetical protein
MASLDQSWLFVYRPSAMSRHLIAGNPLLVALLSATLAHAVVSVGNAQSSSGAVGTGEPFTGVLLLRNGSSIQGDISRSGGRWIVKNEGRELSVLDRNVELAGRSLHELYDKQRKRINRPTADAHLSLADWCIQNDLFAEASQQLADARALDPRHPRFVLMEQRLALAIEQRSRPLVEPISTPPAQVNSSPPNLESNPAATAPPQLSREVVESFTRHVQPILVNNCTTAGCHQPGGPQKFQLDRALLHGFSNRRTTMSNLTATLPLVNREEPAQSPLVTVPRTPHGGMNKPVFGPAQGQLVNQLIEWAQLVAGPPAEKESTVASTLIANAGAPGGLAMPDRAPQAASSEPPLLPQRPPAVRYGAELRRWEPKDPFDPEIFNRIYFSPGKGDGLRN